MKEPRKFRSRQYVLLIRRVRRLSPTWKGREGPLRWRNAAQKCIWHREHEAYDQYCYTAVMKQLLADRALAGDYRLNFNKGD